MGRGRNEPILVQCSLGHVTLNPKPVLEPARGTDFECGYRGLLGRPHSRNSANPNFHLRTPKPKAFVQADCLGREALKLWISEILH